MIALILLSLAGAPAFILGGCASAEIRGGRPYPSQLERLTPLDIQVFRDVGPRELRLTNTSARSLGPSRLWINAWYSASVEPLEVGQTISVHISRFRDEHGERIRGGGFFAARAPEPIVLAELETDGGLRPIVYVPMLDR
ncbi:MAG: hypothetical protein EA376_02735 [Phycisphaeraceae bacterium]|nr:MAG: hypothetical protein EA376_02735 [Phycisphaeraceae bacterium]